MINVFQKNGKLYIAKPESQPKQKRGDISDTSLVMKRPFHHLRLETHALVGNHSTSGMLPFTPTNHGEMAGNWSSCISVGVGIRYAGDAGVAAGKRHEVENCARGTLTAAR